MSNKGVYPYLDRVDLCETNGEDWTVWQGGSIETDVEAEAVDHPTHYHSESGIEVIDAIEAWGLGFSLGNAIKYIARSGRKDPDKAVQDLQKAIWYIQRDIANRESEKVDQED